MLYLDDGREMAIHTMPMRNQYRGAPSWVGLAPTDYVARLPVPLGLTTLTNVLSDGDTAHAQTRAGATTAAALDRLDHPALLDEGKASA